MTIVAIGLNHRSAPLGILERLTIAPDDLPKALADLTSRDLIGGAVILSTCNRTEIYASAEKFHGAYDDLRNFLCDTASLAPEDLAHHLYVHHDAEATRHLFAVAAGLGSAVLGEHEILGQVKTAWKTAASAEAVGPTLNLLFRHAVEAGKRARTDTAIGRHTASVSTAAVEMAKDHVGSLDGSKVLIYGSGRMGEGVARALRDAGAAEISVVNRTEATSAEVAARVGASVAPISRLASSIAEADVVVTSTGAQSVLLDADDIGRAVASRPDRPLLIVDIAVPRDVDAAVGDLDGVTLLNMDDLRMFTESALAERRLEVTAVRTIIEEEVERFEATNSAREVAPLITQLRTSADAVRQAEVAKFSAKLGGTEPTPEQLEAFSKALLAKLLHEPSVRLKDAAGTARGERLAEALRELFSL